MLVPCCMPRCSEAADLYSGFAALSLLSEGSFQINKGHEVSKLVQLKSHGNTKHVLLKEISFAPPHTGADLRNLHPP